MEEFFGLLIALAIAMAVIWLFKFFSNLSEERPSTISLNKDFFKPKLYFFSYHELEFYRLLGEFLSKNHPGKYDIFPKVRLLDLADTDYKINRNKISSKHVDFLIVDKIKHCTPVLAIELNGASHETENMKARDEFVGDFFDIIGIPLLTIHNEELKNNDSIIEKLGSIL